MLSQVRAAWRGVVRPQSLTRCLDRDSWVVNEAVSWSGTGTFATHPHLLPMQLLLLDGPKRALAPHNRHSLRGLAQANSMCCPQRASPSTKRGYLCLGAAHRIFMSHVMLGMTGVSLISPSICMLSYFADFTYASAIR